MRGILNLNFSNHSVVQVLQLSVPTLWGGGEGSFQIDDAALKINRSI